MSKEIERRETWDWQADGNTFIEQGFVLETIDGKHYWVLYED